MIVEFRLAALIGVYLIIEGGWPLPVMGLLLSCRTGKHRRTVPAGIHGLGEVFVFIFIGLVATLGGLLRPGAHGHAAARTPDLDRLVIGPIWCQ